MSATPTGVVAFDWTYFSTFFPECSAPGLGILQMVFNQAGLFCDNSPTSPVADSSVGGQRYLFLHLITAHLSAIHYGTTGKNGQPATPLVGRINSATEGSVTVQTELKVPDGVPQYWAQTKYGIEFWAASSAYRQMFYIPGPRRQFEPYPFTMPVWQGVDPVNPPGPFGMGLVDASGN
jgi:Protein of unknown function (DUF4054)